MKKTVYISISEFCKYHDVKEAFILRLAEYELIELVQIDNEPQIQSELLPELEKMVRLHSELGINLEGIEAVQALLQRMSELQEELARLRQKLSRFDEP